MNKLELLEYLMELFNTYDTDINELFEKVNRDLLVERVKIEMMVDQGKNPPLGDMPTDQEILNCYEHADAIADDCLPGNYMANPEHYKSLVIRAARLGYRLGWLQHG